MKFNQYEKLYEAVSQDALQSILQQTMSPTLVAQVTGILLGAPHSDLSRFIINRLINNPNLTLQKFDIRKVGTLESYKKDSTVYNALLHVTENGVGPGEILISLTDGKWNGGTQAEYDIDLPEIGKVEIKYLQSFSNSANVPLGSSHNKNVKNTDFEKIINNIGQIIRKSPELLKSMLNPREMDYLIRTTLDEISHPEQNLSTNSLRIIARLLRNCEKNKNNYFSLQGITFNKLTKSMEEAILNAIGPSPYIMFIGNRTTPGQTLYSPGIVHPGQYYIMPKEDVKYYMVYRMFKHERIKIAPFTTEKEFFNNTVKE